MPVAPVEAEAVASDWGLSSDSALLEVRDPGADTSLLAWERRSAVSRGCYKVIF